MPTWTIYGELASKANSRRPTKSGRWIKSKKALEYLSGFKAQNLEPNLTEGRVAAFIEIYYASERPDLDESLLLDALQGIAYQNDRAVRWKQVRHRIDKANPRQIVTIIPLDAMPEEVR